MRSPRNGREVERFRSGMPEGTMLWGQPGNMSKTILFDVPIRTVTGLNAREHHQVRAKRAKRERQAAMLCCPPLDVDPVIIVHLIRVGPREADGDNLQGALKHVRDGIAARLKLDDACRLIDWKYSQEKGAKLGVRVEMTVPAKGPAG